MVATHARDQIKRIIRVMTENPNSPVVVYNIIWHMAKGDVFRGNVFFVCSSINGGKLDTPIKITYNDAHLRKVVGVHAKLPFTSEDGNLVN